MPELPEVETTLRALAPHVSGATVRSLEVRQPALRWPVPADLARIVRGQRIHGVERRAKYLLFCFDSGTMLAHLGMSGSIRLVSPTTEWRRHDHWQLVVDDAMALRYHDPRRFGALLWQAAGDTHPLLQSLGPEPLGEAFDGDWLFHRSRGRRTAVKPFIMDGHTVVGVGNIYAAESLFRAGIRPDRAAGSIARQRYWRLAEVIREVLGSANEQAGTTLRDFVSGDGSPGYFSQQLDVYGRAGEACRRCGRTLRLQQLGQRATVYCPGCQR